MDEARSTADLAALKDVLADGIAAWDDVAGTRDLWRSMPLDRLTEGIATILIARGLAAARPADGEEGLRRLIGRAHRHLLAMSDPALGVGETKTGRCEDKLLDTDGHIYECSRFARHEGPHAEGYAIDVDVDVERAFGNHGSASAVTFWTPGPGEELQAMFDRVVPEGTA